MKVYLDNAATTPLAPEVLDAMLPVLKNEFGNPSSTHSFGRKSRSLIEISRRKIAEMLHVSPGEIIFTSGGTEADNMAIHAAVKDLNLTHIITSAIEHHAVGHTIEELKKQYNLKVSFVKLLPNGHIDLEDLANLLQVNDRSFVSLMHANNEIGNLLNIKMVGALCKEFNAVFHSDTVQTMGHYTFNLQELNVHFITGSAHKFHGPKGIGFLYINGDVNIKSFIVGGSQERGMRGGTENIYGIVGLTKALEMAFDDIEAHTTHILGLKNYMIQELEQNIAGVSFNGDAKGKSLYTVLNVLFPPNDKAEMLLFNLDIMGIACSGGSACTSGSNLASHVLEGIKTDTTRPYVRFSFSKYTTKEEIDYTLGHIYNLFK